MKPTAHLRFVDRNEPVVLNGEKFDNWRKVLQQWWACDPDSYTDWVTKTNGYWQDIPLEKEE